MKRILKMNITNVAKLFLLTGAIFLMSFTSQNNRSVDPENSVVNFKIKAMGLFTINGTINGFSGTINFNPEDLENAKIDVCIDASSILTGNKKRDAHVHSEDFMYVEKYPKICFTSTKIVEKSNIYIAQGKLNLRGVKETVEIPLFYESNALKGKMDLNRFDYHIGDNIGKGKAGEEVAIEIIAVLK